MPWCLEGAPVCLLGMSPAVVDPSGADTTSQLQEVHSCSEFELRGIQKLATQMVNLAQQKKHGDEPEGFTRSISLYWHWVRGQKAASKMGKVNSGTETVGSAEQQMAYSCALNAAGGRLWAARAPTVPLGHDPVRL